ncbi:MAG TPA: NIL domain-containing protein [Bacillota bacterium]|jgi:NAD-dependent dihydropyrimidine dehydrogenase PreA subunit
MKRIKALLRFPPNRAGKPITYHLVKDYDLRINILHAEVAANRVGVLVMDVEGQEEAIDGATRFVRDEGVEFHIVESAVSWDRDRCIDCGACTAVCPSGALSLDQKDWSLVFTPADCFVCESCLKACPMRAIAPAIGGTPAS